MKSPLKNLKKYFQLIMTALICFVMGVIEDKKRICIKDTDSKKDRTVLRIFYKIFIYFMRKFICKSSMKML